MAKIVTWLETHRGLSEWAQFLGAILGLVITYFTAFAPHWRRRRQLKNSAARLLQNVYEVLESYHWTSAHFTPTTISIRAAGLTMTSVASEIDRFPIFELTDQGPRSTAWHLVAVGGLLKLVDLAIEAIATELIGRDGTVEDQEIIGTLVHDRLKMVEAIVTGKEIKRPEWPVQSLWFSRTPQ